MCQICKEVMIFHFNPANIVKCNFAFPDGWGQQHRGEEGADHGHFDTEDGEFVWVPCSGDPNAVHGDRHGDAAPGGRGGPRVAVVGLAAARQEAVPLGGVPRPGFRDGLPVPSSPPLLPARRPDLDAWGGGRGLLRGTALGSGWPPLSPPAAPLGPWAGAAAVPGGWG